MKRVVVTGLGLISSLGIGLEESWKKLIDGETGFLANVGDVDKMSADAIKILSDENLLQRMKENAKKQAIRFDIKNIIPQYETMYEQVLVDFNKK